ncbi:MAG: ABC transporter permease [Chloroflexota bacterium]
MNTLRRSIRPEQLREFSLVLIIVLAVLFFGSQIENYYQPRTFNRIATSVAILVVVAVGQTLVVIMRHIDLSVGSIVGFTAYFTGRVLIANPEFSPVTAIIVAMLMGGGLGVINGLLVAYGNVPAIITTLGTLAIYRAVLVSGANAESILTSSLPQWLVDLPRLNAFTVGELEIRMVVLLAVVVVIIFQFLITFLPWGRRLYAIGSNPDAASMAGLPARRATLSAYTICGALSGLGGFLFLARFGTITVVAAQGMELQVVAAVVVGGVNIFGGSGSLIGALLGTILIATLEQSLLRWRVVSEFWRDAVLGLLILLAVAADSVILNNLRSWWSPSASPTPNSQSEITLPEADPAPPEVTP